MSSTIFTGVINPYVQNSYEHIYYIFCAIFSDIIMIITTFQSLFGAYSARNPNTQGQ